ncbi:MAG: hypothetical protein IPL54_10375 [Chitinophagaceae bacterium]|nr:hypothetical protein [Chitinophagaceae bacterium]
MTIIKNSSQLKNILSGIVATTMLLTFYSCAKKSVAVAKTEVPAVVETPAATTVPVENKGQVQIKRDATGNYVIQINLRELEEVNKLEETSKKAYIVWMNADNEKVKSLGQINSNSAWLSDKSKASFEALSVVKPTKVFITEEDLAEVQTPGKKIIWSTNTF